MMLTKEDLQAIGELIAASEERTKTSIMAYIENDVKKEICQMNFLTAAVPEMGNCS